MNKKNNRLIDKARANRSAALNYVVMQRSCLDGMAETRRDAPCRAPLPPFFFRSTRHGLRVVHAAA